MSKIINLYQYKLTNLNIVYLGHQWNQLAQPGKLYNLTFYIILYILCMYIYYVCINIMYVYVLCIYKYYVCIYIMYV